MKGLLNALIVFFALHGSAQQTVGVFVHEPDAFPGYTLFAPSAAKTTYLIDNCGRLIHQWTSQYTPGQSVYLLDDGTLLRTARIGGVFQGGGVGGRVERIDWDNTLLWAYNYASSTFHQHHDVEQLPNGNVLILAWEKAEQSTVLEAGRNPATLTAAGLWPDHIIEVEPVLPDSGRIVWEWHAWDHIIQDYDSAKSNYGVVADHPELIDLNFGTSVQASVADWLHCNSVDYNPGLDQILISVHNFNEIWVIDHSTTIAEASGHSGGNSGRGGDLLYRWGNPQSYRRGGPADRVFDGQHDASWTEEGLPGAGEISVFNNIHGAGFSTYSSADFWKPPYDSSGTYVIEPGAAYGPTSLTWSYDGQPDETFRSNRLSSVQQLPNGNVLVCSGNEGRFIEITQEKHIVWEYISPVGNTVVSQGTNPIINDAFRAERYPVDYSGFNGRDVSPGDPIEFNPLPLMCPEDTISAIVLLPNSSLRISPNPVGEIAVVSNPEWLYNTIDIFDAGQVLIQRIELSGESTEVSTLGWPTGLIIAIATDAASGRRELLKLIKL